MNLALPALVITLLLLPGVLLSYTYRRGLFGKSPLSLGSFPNEVGRGIVWAVGVHAAGALVVGALPWTDLDSSAFLALLSGWPGDASGGLTADFAAVHRNLLPIALYVLVTTAAAAGLGLLFHWAVRRLRLDLRYRMFRFDNDWYYLLSGEARVFRAGEESLPLAEIRQEMERKFGFAMVSALVEHGGSLVLYWGVLVDYYFADGDLDRLVLANAQRRSLDVAAPRVYGAPPPPQDERFYPIDGDYLVLPYASVRNLNVTYSIQDEEPPASVQEEDVVVIDLDLAPEAASDDDGAPLLPGA
ncbi:hypothetical protein [Rubrivirga sp.]|uniref:hypothetical protein n=1 Tax=Rubrivirga sp. TaxID=1885344 RepID=UPI003B51EBEF